MLKILKNGNLLTKVDNLEEFEILMDDLYPDGVPEEDEIYIDAEDLLAFRKKGLSADIDDELEAIGVTSREMRIITANGALLAFYGLARVIKAIESGNDVDIADLVPYADTLLALDNTNTMISSVLGKGKIIEDILRLSVATGTVVREKKQSFENDN